MPVPTMPVPTMIPPDPWLPGGLALLAAALLAPWLAGRLRGPGWLDRPRADRHADRAVPRAGGAAWLGAFVLATIAGLALSRRGGSGGAGELGSLPAASLALSVAVGGAGFWLGHLDDRGVLGAGRKWIVQTALLLAAGFLWILVAASLTGEGRAWAAAGGWGRILSWSLRLGLALLVQTALQIFDNVDAALGSVFVASCAVLALRPEGGAFALPAVLAGAAALGVLAWNLPPARLYFGNAGSLPLATLLAFWILAGGRAFGESPGAPGTAGGATAVVIAVVAGPLLWPLIDLVYVSIARGRRGVPPWVGGRDHTTHLLARRLGSDRRVAGLLLLWAVLSAFLALRLPGPR